MTDAKMGGASRLRLFVKANDDVTDALLRGERLRLLAADEYGGRFEIETDHEPMPRSDVLCQQLDGAPVPPVVADLGLSAMGDTGLFAPRDVVVLSMQAEVENSAWREPESGYLVAPGSGSTSDAVVSALEPVGLISAAHSGKAMMRLVGAVKERSRAHVIVFNCSSVIPGDDVHCYAGSEPTLAERIHTFNLEAVRLSVQQGISVVDADRIVAELGAGRHVTAPLHYSDQAGAALASETLRVISELGFFEDRPLVPQVGQGGG